MKTYALNYLLHVIARPATTKSRATALWVPPYQIIVLQPLPDEERRGLLTVAEIKERYN